MRRTQYDELFHSALLGAKALAVSPKVGPRKGQRGVMELIGHCKITVGFADGQSVTFRYPQVDVLDENGQPFLAPVLDLTGREITEGATVTYSVLDGRCHGVEIGKVQKISETGFLTVRRLVMNGEAVGDGRYARKVRTVTDCNRVLRLPFDDADLSYWFLSGVRSRELPL